MNLDLSPALSRPELLAKATAAALADWPGGAETEVAPIDPDLADTAAFCAHYGVELTQSANCVVVAGKRGGVTSYAACLVTAVTRADVNGVVRRRMDARKATFAPLDDVVAATGMEYGGITPIGLPCEWPILIDARVVEQGHVVIGSGIRGSKLWLPGASLATLPGAEVIDGLASPVG
jgi:prolyl-tRNA editing enzyme YbaK/EbsC (Cys-tRNA(Pro) deacylase)